MEKLSAESIVYPTNPPFRTLLLHRLINDGQWLSYKEKCLGLGIVLYVCGLLAALASKTHGLFIWDYGFLALSMGASLTLLSTIYACNQIDPTLRSVGNVICHSEHGRYSEFLKAVRSEIWLTQPAKSKWRKVSPSRWYVVRALRGA